MKFIYPYVWFDIDDSEVQEPKIFIHEAEDLETANKTIRQAIFDVEIDDGMFGTLEDDEQLVILYGDPDSTDCGYVIGEPIELKN